MPLAPEQAGRPRKTVQVSVPLPGTPLENHPMGTPKIRGPRAPLAGLTFLRLLTYPFLDLQRSCSTRPCG